MKNTGHFFKAAQDLLNEAEERLHTDKPHIKEGLSEEDYNELALFANSDDPEKDTITFDELKTSLSRWMVK